MNNILFNVSVAAFQKKLEKKAASREYDEGADLSLETSNEKVSTSIKKIMLEWISGPDSVQPTMATSKFKNRAVW